MTSDRLTHAGAIERAWGAALRAEMHAGNGRLEQAHADAAVGRTWAAIAGQLPVLDVAPCPAGSSCYALDEPATELIPRVEPGQGGDPGLWCWCGRPGYAEPHAMTDGCS
jgi:hypothetical protein